jgi:hypothetical protein
VSSTTTTAYKLHYFTADTQKYLYLKHSFMKINFQIWKSALMTKIWGSLTLLQHPHLWECSLPH